MGLLLRASLVLAITLLALASAGVMKARAAEPVTIRIGYAAIGVGNVPYANGTSAATARAGRFVEQEFQDDPSVTVEWYFFKGAGPAVNEAFANSQLDFAYQGDLPSIIGRANGLKTHILLASGAHKPVFLAVPASSDVKTIEDLKGRKVAIFRGTNTQLAVDKVLAAHGLSEQDLKVISLDDSAAPAALAARDIDAAFGDTELIALAKTGLARIAYTSQGDNPAFGRYAALLGLDGFTQAHPDLTRRVVKAFVKAAEWSSEDQNRAALFELWARSGTPVDVLEVFFHGDSLNYRNSPLLDPLMVHTYADLARQAKAFGQIRRDVEIDGWFEPKYLDAALKDLSLEHYWRSYDAAGRQQTAAAVP
jgi:sulfonate transport system substrate-binding protein